MTDVLPNHRRLAGKEYPALDSVVAVIVCSWEMLRVSNCRLRAGTTALFQSLRLLQYAVAWFILINLIVLFHEEPVLRRRFGESYERYIRSVHRWLPREPDHETSL